MREVPGFNPIRDIAYFKGKTCSTATQEYNINIVLSMHDSKGKYVNFGLTTLKCYADV